MRKDEIKKTTEEQLKATEQSVFLAKTKGMIDSNADSSICKQINNFLAMQTNQLFQRDYLAEKIVNINDPLKSLGYGSSFSVFNGEMQYSTHYVISSSSHVELTVTLDESNNINKEAVKVGSASVEAPHTVVLDFDDTLKNFGQDIYRFNAFIEYLKDVNSKYNSIMSEKSKKRK